MGRAKSLKKSLSKCSTKAINPTRNHNVNPARNHCINASGINPINSVLHHSTNPTLNLPLNPINHSNNSSLNHPINPTLKNLNNTVTSNSAPSDSVDSTSIFANNHQTLKSYLSHFNLESMITQPDNGYDNLDFEDEPYHPSSYDNDQQAIQILQRNDKLLDQEIDDAFQSLLSQQSPVCSHTSQPLQNSPT
ncbi:hypothetical protein HK099_007698 [Clydaea vesicula]|uniref:Uncharacterized protein n=1 Tax=Clydaea vesicula TaxID=447962 RepID=A0AAD5XTK3_9FUNG|nr:hypothetical protein HK099_007698 [Clydaea vesicula]KAJ3397416.1 hypothetical protein HDU92_007805 [Lobulomyces angularis]